jgi:hypothetical protein
VFSRVAWIWSHLAAPSPPEAPCKARAFFTAVDQFARNRHPARAPAHNLDTGRPHTRISFHSTCVTLLDTDSGSDISGHLLVILSSLFTIGVASLVYINTLRGFQDADQDDCSKQQATQEKRSQSAAWPFIHSMNPWTHCQTKWQHLPHLYL